MKIISETIQTTLFQQIKISIIVSDMTINNMTDIKSKFTMITRHIKTRFNQIDQVFSLQKPASLVSRFKNGDTRPLFHSRDFQAVYSLARTSKEVTDGYFDPFDGGRYTPSDLIKSWAVDQVFSRNLKPLVNGPVVGIMIEADGIIQTAVAKNSRRHWPVLVHDSYAGGGVLEKYQLAGDGIVTVNAQTSKRMQSAIKQLTIISERVSDATTWAIAGLNAGTNRFLRLINQNRLSGILIDRALGVIEFESGKLRYKQVS
ncbi:FAD:protein FMN transferase [Lentilactobacillus hilgardii]|uniref:FAD:protein FMN transferase n=1 Tax=Lentilactobacillus hilgardii TaxID=1588 RepID=UPI0021A81BBA|nr:FAD:protein FMN transferase [Lentilactobacillus hilgardii]MCT3399883.1 hypothetical protein [Lentilactobacillus hilgardii]